MYVSIDTETGGFSKTKNGVCEIGMVIAERDFTVVNTFHYLIKPYCQEDSDELVVYHPDAMAVNGICISDLETKGKDVTDVIGAFIAELYHVKSARPEITIIGHNSKRFDFPVLNYLCERFNQKNAFLDHFQSEDTMLLAKEKLFLPSYSLESLCNHFEIKNEKAHSALGDAYATLELFKHLQGLD
ncbi:hypothetical protein CHRYSEOSP005_14760 [Chryseobacterium sp. Alg-005]|uniref:3'-5' exonuclease n=1 Tax=Chryseobacterium sp. Alg-005 TaxID=3159516 RepID=UPI003555A880